MKKSIIVAQATNRVIGSNNQLPWRLPADLKYFKKITHGHPIIMGRTTFESIGFPLPSRTNIILTRCHTYTAPANCKTAHDLEEAFSYATQQNTKEVFIIGGAQIYQQTLLLADALYITQIHASLAGDTFFPCIDPAQWQEVSRVDHPADKNNIYPYSFVRYLRKNA